ncbi:MAG: sulfite exporter TauE/SafE family protein [Marmoricola sp.]
MALVLVAGATVQSLVGLGLGLVAAPIVTLLQPDLMPELLLVLGALLPVLTLIEERGAIDWRGLGWALPARLPGTWVGVALLAAASATQLDLVIGSMVLVAVALTAFAPVIPKSWIALVTAGFFSGISATTSAIGGPPMALVYQSRPRAEIRSTLAVYFIVGSLISLGGLALGGHFSWRVVLLGLAMSPTLAIGAALARVLQGRVAGERVRLAVLIVCAASAGALLIRDLV